MVSFSVYYVFSSSSNPPSHRLLFFNRRWRKKMWGWRRNRAQTLWRSVAATRQNTGGKREKTETKIQNKKKGKKSEPHPGPPPPTKRPKEVKRPGPQQQQKQQEQWRVLVGGGAKKDQKCRFAKCNAQQLPFVEGSCFFTLFGNWRIALRCWTSLIQAWHEFTIAICLLVVDAAAIWFVGWVWRRADGERHAAGKATDFHQSINQWPCTTDKLETLNCATASK